MRKKLSNLIIVAALALVAFGQAQAQTDFAARLTHDQEPEPAGTTPPLTSTGDPPPLSFGTASFTLNNAETALTMNVTVFNIDVTGTQTPDTNDNLTAAHIHAPAPPGSAGPVVWGFFGTPDNDTNPKQLVVTPFPSGVGGTFSSTWDLPEGNAGTTLAAQLPNIKAGLAYINFHTVQFGGGEIRGQILSTQTFVVNSTADTDDGSCDPGNCTLREAINAANAAGTDDTINFDLPPESTITLLTALPPINDTLTINGIGANWLKVERSAAVGTPEFRIFTINPGVVATIARLTVSNGRVSDGIAVGKGGGILNDGGTLDVVSCTVSGNYASAGAGLYNDSAASPGITATLNITNSTVSGNTARDYGAGVLSFVEAGNGTAVLNITNSTISGNTVEPAGAGGGGVVSATSASGATATAAISNSTITNNTGGDAGGVSSFVGGPGETTTVRLRSTIVAGNFQTGGAPGDIQGAVDPKSDFNLIGTGGSGGLTNGVNQNQVGIADPMLAPLGYYGGRLQTHALLAGSPATDRGINSPLPTNQAVATDERGASFKRTVDIVAAPNAAGGDSTDVGAYELQPLFQFDSATYSVGESGTQATITVRLTAALAETATVDYATSDGTAAEGQDYTDTFCTLTFAPGETTQSFTVPITNDALDEDDETVNLTLGNPTGAMLGEPDEAVLTILDNDAAPVLSVNSPAATEGNSAVGVNFTVSLSKPSAKVVTVQFQTADGTAKAPADYTPRGPATLTFLPGQTSRTVTVTVKGDLRDEPTETFRLSLSSPTNATIMVFNGTCTITDDDPPPSVTITNATVTEPDAGAVNATFTVKLSAASGRTVTVKFATADGTAAAGSDYTARALTTLTFAPGETSKTVSVPVRGDVVKEPYETFFVNLSGAVNATITDEQGLGTIANDD